MPDVPLNQPGSPATSDSQSNLVSLSVLWAKKYIASVSGDADHAVKTQDFVDIKEATSLAGRQRTADHLLGKLDLASAKAWSQVEILLAEEVRRHGIKPDLIDPWRIIQDIRLTFQEMLSGYASSVLPARLSVVMGQVFGQVRQKYTQDDPRVIGFVSMQFHFTGRVLLEWLSPIEAALLGPYLKVMDDHLYMPLQRAYAAAAKYDYQSPTLQVIQKLLEASSDIAMKVCDRVAQEHVGYQTYSGKLTDREIRISSLRDVEMFQVYLCLCVLERGINAIKDELFPLCVMLYPRLQVSWQLVQDMLKHIFWQLQDRFNAQEFKQLQPYLQAMIEMFSDEVFQALSLA